MRRPPGLYETLITQALHADLSAVEDPDLLERTGLRPAEAADRVALHLGRLIQRAISLSGEKERSAQAVQLACRLIEVLNELAPKAECALDAPVGTGEVLRAILERLPDGSRKPIPEPLIPLLDTALLTNAPGEPRVGNQVLAEVPSADRIDVVMAFIRRTGLKPLQAALAAHCGQGRALRILTTTYTGSTEAAALDALQKLGAEVRVSYDTSTTRLHAKTWLFHRTSGFSTAYVGSSNLTHSAQVTGLEWNVRISGARNPDVVDKMAAVFESYWNSPDFVAYEPSEFRERTRDSGATGPSIVLSPIELRPEPFQERLLELIEVARQKGHHRNLLVAATGTGKTVMAALDYARLRERLPRARLLFVAHREEILSQSLATFRHCLRDHAFGELWVAGKRPSRFEHVFASIQSLTASNLEHLVSNHLAPDHFDIVIIDEFHHAAARSYRALLEHLRPVELLGLTATPERSDGQSVLELFGGRIAAELRLWDAIDQQRLCPFVYYGIHDGLDLRQVPWKRGRGYDAAGLSNVYTANDAWARLVLSELQAHVDDVHAIRCLGFCVSVEHAQFMARIFQKGGVRAVAVWADTPASERKQALDDLAQGRISVLFSVDLFNEGVDVPDVDTLLLLRPTDSPTLFLQQLGRGLRKRPHKAVCTVLEFVGVHRAEFRIDRRYLALLGGTRRGLIDAIKAGFPFLPAGCHMQLDAVAREEVLRNIERALPSRWDAKVGELRALSQGGDVSLGHYLAETGLALEDVYTDRDKGWSKLREDASLPCLPAGPHEIALRRACGRLLHVDDMERIAAFRRLLTSQAQPDLSRVPERERRLWRMLVAQVVDQVVTKDTPLADGVAMLRAHPQVGREIMELLDVLQGQVSHVHTPLDAHRDVPLQIHASYTRLEILAAIGRGTSAKVTSWQTGVLWDGATQADLLAFTLDKTSGQFSPTTRYRDYAISPTLIHWESQSITRADSDTGRRYQTHAKRGTSVWLFARLNADARAFWFLGPASYVKHESEQPMAITWRLRHPLPGDLFTSFAAAVA